MDKQNTNWFFILGWALILALGLFFMGFFLFRANSNQSQYGSTNSISVNGEGKASVKPDMLVVNVSISELASTTEWAQTQSNEKLQKLKTLLTTFNIPDANLKTTSVNTYPEYDWKDSGRSLLGYRSQHSLSINITGENFGEIGGNLITEIAKIGWVNVDGSYFDLKDKNAAMQTARENALNDAKTKAEQLAKASGMKIKKVLTINDNGSYYNGVSPMYATKWMGNSAEIAVDQSTSNVALAPGETEVTVNVTVVYKIR